AIYQADQLALDLARLGQPNLDGRQLLAPGSALALFPETLQCVLAGANQDLGQLGSPACKRMPQLRLAPHLIGLKALSYRPPDLSAKPPLFLSPRLTPKDCQRSDAYGKGKRHQDVSDQCSHAHSTQPAAQQPWHQLTGTGG